MYLVGRNFYSRFLPQVREVAGADGEDIIEEHVASHDLHQWLRDPNQSNAILGFGGVAGDGDG
jgi:hypothetical protein